MNLSVSHYVLLALSAAVAICQYVGAQFPAQAPLTQTLSAVFASLMGTLGILSPSADGATVPAPVAPATSPAVAAAGALVQNLNAADKANLAALLATEKKA